MRFTANSRTKWPLAAVLGLLTAACAPRAFDGAVYRGEGFAFRIPPTPPSWKPLDVSDAALAYRDERHGGTVLLNARCGMDGDEVPLVALTTHLFFDFTERDIKQQEVVPFDGREAMHTLISARLDGVPMSYDVWVLKKDGCVYDMIYAAPEESFDSGRDDFTTLVRGFETVEPHGK
jgi:hypothetical protein